MARYQTVEEAAQAWVNEFSHIPIEIAQKLLKANCAELMEVTPPTVGDRVFIYSGKHDGDQGNIAKRDAAKDGDQASYTIRLDNGGECVVEEEDFEVCRYDTLPMWGTMWAFSEQLDNDWLAEDDGLRLMADCGFRIYEQEDYGYIFGIDGAGYSFMEEHWIPLYKARGLQWHENKEEAAV